MAVEHRLSRRGVASFGVAAVAAATAVQLAGLAPALANAANPAPDITSTETQNNNGSVTLQLSGTWVWPGQNCAGRYGTGWAVDWWGISGSGRTPTSP